MPEGQVSDIIHVGNKIVVHFCFICPNAHWLHLKPEP